MLIKRCAHVAHIQSVSSALFPLINMYACQPACQPADFISLFFHAPEHGMVYRVSRLSPPAPPSQVIQCQRAQLTSEVAHDALVYYCKMLGLAWLGFVVLGCWRTSTKWKECALTAPVGEGHAISSNIYRHLSTSQARHLHCFIYILQHQVWRQLPAYR